MSRAIPQSQDDTAAQIVLLDANYCVVASSLLTATGPVKRLAQDVRLFVHDDKLYASYVVWQFDPTRTEGKGLWLAPINMEYTPLTSRIDSSRAVRLGGYEEKNYGLFHYQSKMMALTWIDWTNRPAPRLGSVTDGRPTAEKTGKWHNSANLLQLRDGSGHLLGMMHMHSDHGSDNGGPRFGTDYRQRFFKLSGSLPFVMNGVGEEFCMKAKDGSCESVQMIMSMMQTSNDDVLVSYGVNDCESKVASFTLSSILQQLVPPPLGKEKVELMQVPEVQLPLLDLAETVSPAPFWPYGRDDQMSRSYDAGLKLPSSLYDMERYQSCKAVAGTYGDWPVCNDWLPKGCTVYDFGIANEWAFSDSMATQHGCEVHSFDPSDGHLEEHHAHHQTNVSFHPLGLSGGEEDSLSSAWHDTSGHGYGAAIGPLRRLDHIMATLGHSAVDVLKIDCEGCEWEALAGVARAAPEALSCVHVLLIELHFAKRFAGSNSSLIHAAETYQHLRSNGWKTWFAVQRGWGPDQTEQELLGWKEVGGDSCCYNVGFVNPRFDVTKCAFPKSAKHAKPA
jgi:FkbM family methyltransferase